MPVPTISGPISNGARGHAFAASSRDLASLGYIEEEYFLEGEAQRFIVTDTPVDGRFVSEKEAGSAPYRTRLLVRRPLDPAAFNGTLIVHWTNVSIGWENIEDFEAITDGFAFIAVSVQGVGLDGFPGVPFALKAWDPERYGSLQLPGDAYSFDIFSQAALAVGTGGARQGVDPLDGLTVKHRVAEGDSQSASRLISQLNGVQPIDPAFDAYVSVIDFGPFASFDDRVHDEAGEVEYTPEGFAAADIPMAQKRDDLGVKILAISSESEARARQSVAQPDTDTHRAWFVAGAAHMGAMPVDVDTSERDGLPSLPLPPTTPSLVNYSGVVEAGLHAVHHWLETGEAPSAQPRFEFDSNGGSLERDADGLVVGGIRLPEVAVPAAINAGEGANMTGFAALIGSNASFSIEKIRELYPSDEDYVARVKSVVDGLVADRVLLQRTADRYVAAAATGWLGSLTPRS
jgi:hypothetical protein